MAWEPIVVGVDTSPGAVQAAAFASGLARRAATTCYLVHATRDVLASADVAANGRYRAGLLMQARHEIGAALGAAVPARLLQTLRVDIGAPAGVLKHVVQELGAELLVVGGKPPAALNRWFGGSTSLTVARTTAVPLLVTAGPAGVIRRVLVAVDRSGAARPTLAAAERYAGLFGAELRAVSVLEPLPLIPTGTPPNPTDYYVLSEELLQRQVWTLIRRPGTETVVRHGAVLQTILREVADWQPDLLVVGSHGKGWVERMLLGSVTERLLNQLPTSLLVVPVPASAVAELDHVHETELEAPAMAVA